MTSDPFESPLDLIEHARDHISDLETRWSDYQQSKPWVIEERPHGQGRILVGKITSPLPRKISRTAYDVSNSLRSALDQATHASVFTLTGKDRSHGTGFPFGDTPEEAERALTRSKTYLAPEIQRLCLAARPYKQGTHQLWYLNKLRNRGSHRTLVTAGMDHKALKVETCTVAGYGCEFYPNIPLESGARVILWISPFSTYEFRGDLVLELYSGTIEGVVGPPAIPFFRQTADVIEGVVRSIKAETLRLLGERG